MPAGVRKAHTKSRNGCAQCKKRRIKCDEQAPCCGNCRKRNVECEYSQLGCPPTITPRAIVPRGTSSPSEARGVGTSTSKSLGSSVSSPTDSTRSVYSSIAPPPPPPPPRPPAELNLHDLELMHQYSTSTYLSLAPMQGEDARAMWQDTVPQEALKYEFLMHGVLSIAALHLAYLRPAERARYTYMARAHNDRALARFRSAMLEITPENCTASIVFSLFLIVFSFGLPLLPDPTVTEPVDPVESFIQVLSVLRGTSALFDSVREWAMKGPIGSLPGDHALGLPLISADERTASAVDYLEALNDASADPAEIKAIYAAAIRELRLGFHVLSTKPATWNRMVVWPAEVGRDFFTLVQQMQPLALALVAHWCIPIHHAPKRWFLQDWGERVIKGIAERLGEAWLPAMRWPLEQIAAGRI